MRVFRSIRFRMVAIILIFGALLVITNTIITFVLMGKNMGRLVDNLLSTEMEYFLYQYEKDQSTPLPHSKYIHAFRGADDLPNHFHPLMNGLTPGIHVLFPQPNRPPIHVGVFNLPDTGERYFFIFHGRAFFDENEFLKPRQILLISLALLLIPGSIIGLVTSRVLFRPMQTLMEKIKGLHPDNIPEQWTEGSVDSEVGMLSATIESAMNRIREFINREKQFTRDASHELRTPLTVVKGAVEVMETQPEIEKNPLLKKPLGRISGSVRDMEITINTFLWLAREEKDSGETCRVRETVEKAVEDNRHLIENREVAVHIDIEGNPVLGIREEVLYITLSNLIRNAFQYTRKGSVHIMAGPHGFTIRDTGMGIEPDQLDQVTRSHIKGEKSRGFGLGLSIVSRLCKRFGWQLEIVSHPGEGTRVRIRWNTSISC